MSSPIQAGASGAPGAPGRGRFLAGVCAAVLYALLAALLLRPIGSVFRNQIAPGPGDPILNLYFLKWGIHQFGQGLPNVWDANFFYPLHGVLTFSDHLLGPAFQLFLLRPVVANPIAGYNLLLWSSFVLTGLTTAWVLRQAGCSRPAAFVGGALFAFCPLRWSQLAHLQLLLVQWVPVTLWSFDRLLVERTARRAGVFLGCYVLHVTGGAYLAYMIHVPLASLLLVHLARDRRQLLAPRALRVLVPTGLVAFLVVGAIFLPYARFAHSYELGRGVEEVGKFGATFSSYVSPAPQAVYFGPEVRRFLRQRMPPVEAALTRTENALFPGLLAVAFGVVGLLAARGRRSQDRPRWRTWRALWAALSFGVAIASLWAGDLLTHRGSGRGPLPTEGTWWLLGGLAGAGIAGALALRRWSGARPLLDRARLGPAANWWLGLALGGAASLLLSLPSFYVPAMRLLPGLSGMRVASRFGLFVTFVLAAFAARGLDAVAGRFTRRLAYVAFWGALAVVAAFDLSPRGVHWVQVLEEEEFPPVYRWLAAHPEVAVVVEVPMTSNSRETNYMYYSTAHWKPIANGFSGYNPPLHQELAERLHGLPAVEDLARLRELGISHVVLHADHSKAQWSDAEIEDWESRMSGEVERVFSADRDFVYAIRPRRAPNS